MESSVVSPRGSQYSQKCASCRTLICCATFEERQGLFIGKGGKSDKSCKNCRANASQKFQDRRLTILIRKLSLMKTSWKSCHRSWSNRIVIYLTAKPNLLRFE
ncbi:hypothetical protein POJ06DRAFT_125551 [Lipomyces tetrasporus]|uniref:Uncharacterized protein n=1 Tax=Lipomyces tetrasporus TaxID=54092 RepID=A0AAD7QRY9_9ASCO|nr:uncharacterized protein POJ06DRAFT_125551 [Lipomyces tetrasporus]KAJ8100171.1 hypothetical protein POJ06DRAFT_125551 [Lipomyces tetrasporus]